MWAAQRGNEKMVMILIDYGADMNPRDAFGRTAIDLAENKGHDEVFAVSLFYIQMIMFSIVLKKCGARQIWKNY